MTADDVRARFEAWFGAEVGPDLPLNRMADGGYLCWETGLAWNAYRAAHADLSGEVRELRGLASSWERFAETMPHGPVGEARRSEAHKCALELSIAIDRFTHQEKP